MSTIAYASFVQWAMFTHGRGNWDAVDLSEETTAWIRLFGRTAGRMDKFLRLGHPNGHTLPNSLVLDISDLNSSPLSKTHKDELLRTLLLTWAGMVDVYGRTSDPSSLEMTRLELLADWGHTLLGLPESGFPGGVAMIIQYRYERARLDFGKLRRGRNNFKYVGLVLDLIRLQERVVWPKPAELSVGKQARAGAIAKEVPDGGATKQRPRSSDFEADQVPCLPTSRGPWLDPSATLAYQLFGNWRDDWRNTLPST